MVENMSYLTCPDCGKKIYLFGEGKTRGGRRRATVCPCWRRCPSTRRWRNSPTQGRIEDFEGDWLDGAAARL